MLLRLRGTFIDPCWTEWTGLRRIFFWERGFFMFFLYLDESGSNTTHFVLVGLAIPALSWRDKSIQVGNIKDKYQISGKEIHTAWMVKKYIEQDRIAGFENLNYADRRAAVEREQQSVLHWLATTPNRNKLIAKKKDIKKIRSYIHLTLDERRECIREFVDLITTWTDSRLFAEAIEVKEYDLNIDSYENAFTNVISRFDNFLRKISKSAPEEYRGIVIQDSNKVVQHRLKDLMKEFHQKGTIWTNYTRIIETPFFVDSELTRMIQVVDICAYMTRRFFENNETDLFDRIYGRFDRLPTRGTLTGLRHYTGQRNCDCRVCRDHSK